MIIRLELPDPVWGRLASVADHQGVKVADVITDALWHVLEQPHKARQPRGEFTAANLEQLNAELSAARRDGFRSPRRNRPTGNALPNPKGTTK